MRRHAREIVFRNRARRFDAASDELERALRRAVAVQLLVRAVEGFFDGGQTRGIDFPGRYRDRQFVILPGVTQMTD